jgi:hypothetical protein
MGLKFIMPLQILTSKMVKLPVPLASRFTMGDFKDITGASVSRINTFPVSLNLSDTISLF